MTYQVQSVSKETTQGLILSLVGDTLSENDVKLLHHYVNESDTTWVGVVDGDLVCAWGVIPLTLVSTQVYLWMYASPKLADHKFIFVRRSQQVLEQLFELYDTIVGHVDPANKQAVQWLTWLKADFGSYDNGYRRFIIRKV